MKTPDKIRISEQYNKIEGFWNPAIAASVNNHDVKLARIKGSFTWHKHDKEDELFFVVEGVMKLHFRDKTVTLSEGDMIVVPQGIEHKPEAEDECKIMMVEPQSTVNTGDVVNEYTRKTLKRL
ncbi:MAG TPA: cupin domain-containing protein [Bacteroidales bacterium]|nr:cupin domain-containing protein [Bacteroidales bacterium]